MRLSKPFTQTPTASLPKLNFSGGVVGQRAVASAPSAIWPRPFVSYWDGILAYFDTKLTSGAIEAVNGIIQLAKRMARGFRNFVYFRTAAYHRAGQLNLDVPNMS